ncbi:MAG: FIG000605: protein co-occurring with transport systems (COG1739) [uncultured Sulfurovum sp.]|uniref:FIG000605: protein co-occurring with transport systems (COG1739) n=1 Tax=uncultured Sulfurovum sp. TaxID=269237 RepID=A0A6S6UBE2_9BACT|nr:MAG: FIG000605: protein co-occurring with transport systems (COG1739) [uncultured Sulfurovum sp.]
MFTVENIYTSTTEVKRSKFLTQIIPISKLEGLQANLKKEHPKANHVVYALRYLNEFDQIVENSTDDGEPKGCAGMPALNVLRGEELVNCAVLIVRYFGGIKLGTGGMARAYAQAVKDVLEVSTLVSYEKQIVYTFETSYSAVDKTLYQLKQLGIEKYEREFGIDGVVWRIEGSEENVEKCRGLYGV